ncbi:hypothetical protein H5A27_22545, partial [Pectobacterium brasiliense]|nr:hypothetical protein [Pectobacterium brasiliense]
VGEAVALIVKNENLAVITIVQHHFPIAGKNGEGQRIIFLLYLILMYQTFGFGQRN